MGYLTMDSGLDMDTCTISFWFRIPSSSFMQAAVADPSTGLGNTIGLFVFGAQGAGTLYGGGGHELISAWPPVGPTGLFTSDGFAAVGSTILLPSYIGVNCGNSPPTLEVWLQTNENASGSNLSFASTKELVYQGESWVGQYTESPTDTSAVVTGIPEVYGNRTGGNGTPLLQVDRWQHLLLSWRLGEQFCTGNGDPSAGGVTSAFATTSAKMYCAVNNVNKSGYDLPCGWIGQDDGLGDSNAALTNNIGAYAGVHDRGFGGGGASNLSFPDIVYFTPSLSFGGGHLDTSVISVPGPLSVDQDTGSKTPVYVVEMAELQVFPGVLLDTSSAYNRALFVNSNGKPTDMTIAEGVLGAPAIQLKGKANWIAGVNTGAGSGLSRVGTINPYPDTVGL